MWEKLEGSGGKGYLTVLTKEFLCEDVLKGGEGHKRIVDNEVNKKSYNVPFHNAKQEGLHNQKKITIVRLNGKLELFCQ